MRFRNSRALGLPLLVNLVPVARALMLVSVSPRRHTLAVLTAYPAVLQAPVLHSCLLAPFRTLAVTKG